MAKRFTDTFKWQRPWYRNLPPKYRELWNYILDMCDHSGIWYVDLQMAGLILNFSDLDLGEAKKLYEKQIRVIDDSRWFIVDFIPFQYGKLTNSKFHISISATLKKFKLKLPKGYGIPYHGTPLVKDKDRVKDKEDVKDVRETWFKAFWNEYPRKVGKQEALALFLEAIKNEVDFNNLMVAARNYKAEIVKNETQEKYIKHGSTFLSKERWKDYVEVSSGANNSASSVDLKAEFRAKREAEKARTVTPPRALSTGIRDSEVVSHGEGRGSSGGSDQ